MAGGQDGIVPAVERPDHARRPTGSATVFARRPDVLGHRGLGRGVVDGSVENSVESLVAAAAAGVDWVELDVSRCADDVLVVHHNPSTGDGRFLVERTAAELAGDGVATLDEVLAALPPDQPVDLDLKPVLEDALAAADAGTVGLLAPVLRREARRRRLLVTSFDSAALGWLRDGQPDLVCGLLTWLDFPLRIAVPMAARLAMPVLGVHHRSLGPNDREPGPVHRDLATNVAIAHEAGLEVLAWCPGADDAEGLVGAGVDALVVNDVPRLLPLVRALGAA